MNRSRSHSHGLAIGMLATTSVACIVLGAVTLSGFGSSGAGDLLVSSTPTMTTVLLIIGVLVLIELELSHMAGHRSSRPARVPRAVAVRA